MRLTAFFLCLPLFCFSQPTLDFEQFLAKNMSAAADVRSREVDGEKFPWFDKWEFRTETNDFDWQRQEYTLRVSPNSPAIRKAQQLYLEELRQAPVMVENGLRCEDFLELHQDWISLFALEKKVALLRALDSVLDKKLQIATKMAEAFTLEPDKILDIRAELGELELAIRKMQLERDFLIDKYHLGDYQLDFHDLVSMDSIKLYLQQISVQSLSVEPEMLALMQEQRMLQREMDLEKAERKKVIDFLQLRYNGPHDDPWKERLSIGLGFQLSNSGSQKLKIQKLLIEQSELKREMERKKQRQQEKMEELRFKLQRDIQLYEAFHTMNEEAFAKQKEFGMKAAQSPKYSPLYLLTVESKKIEAEIDLIDLQVDILKAFFLLAKENGRLCQGID